MQDLIGPALLVLTLILWFRRMSGVVVAFDDIGAVLHWGDPSVSLDSPILVSVGSDRL